MTALLFFPGHARAEWLEASSPHFLVYADQGEKQVRQFTDRLERYRSAMRFLYKLPDEATSPSNRLTVFVVRDGNQVRKLLGEGSRYIQGFYQSRAGASVAFVPRVEGGGRSYRLSEGELVLLHEYAHHFMYSVFSGSTPLWFSEGFAEFYASAKFDIDGAVGLGLPANHRAAELVMARHVPLAMLVNTRMYRASATSQYDAFYGRSWLLFHYLTLSGNRPGQMNDYLRRINEGEGEEAAATGAFGDLDELDKELERYMRSRRMTYMRIPPERITSGHINIRPLSRGEAAILPVVMRSRRGVDEDQAALVVEDARKLAAQYPGEAFVESALAEAEYDAGHDAEAIAAADRALAIDSRSINAYIQKIYALFRMAENDGEEGDWKTVRAAISSANALEYDNPIPLKLFYATYKMEGKPPPPVAIQGLQKALVLAPYDTSLRLSLARHQIDQGERQEAEQTLGPLLNHPHDNRLAKLAQRLLNNEPDEATDGDAEDDSAETSPARMAN